MTCISEIYPLKMPHKANHSRVKVAEDAQIEIYSSVNQLPFAWDKLSSQTSVFLQKNYLEALEAAAPKNYHFFYLLFRAKGKAVGISIAHFFPFSGSEGISIDRQASNWQQKLQRWLLKGLNWNFLVLGNSTLTGEYGTYFLPTFPKTTSSNLLLKASEAIQQSFSLKVDVVVSKDWYGDQQGFVRKFLENGFHECAIQPNMLLPIPAAWQIFDDYLAAMRSKYRIRAKRAMKKLGRINKYYLDVAQIKTQEEKIHRLYQNVAERADLNVAQLPVHYFYTLKRQLGNDFQMLAYFDENELIGFCTSIRDERTLEAHFLGLDENYNTSHQLYLNMLLDLVHSGIEQNMHEIAFSRTALEIKSSIGAVPRAMFGYIKHKNSLVHPFIPFLFRFFGAEIDWVQRHPFKEWQVERASSVNQLTIKNPVQH